MTSGTKERVELLREALRKLRDAPLSKYIGPRDYTFSSQDDTMTAMELGRDLANSIFDAVDAAVEREGAPAPFTFTLEEIMTALDVASEGRSNWQGIKPDLLGNQLVRVMRRKLERTAQSPVAPVREAK